MISVTIKVAEHKDVVSFAARTCDDSFLYFYPFSSILTSQEPKDWKGSWLLGRQPQVHGWDNNDDDDDDDDDDDEDDGEEGEDDDDADADADDDDFDDDDEDE